MVKNQLKFGKVRSLDMSMYGPAFPTSDSRLISYDTENERWVDVTSNTFQSPTLYMVPVLVDKLAQNDFILYNGMWARVVEIGSRLVIEKIFEKELCSVFQIEGSGANFVTRLVYYDFRDLVSGDLGKEELFSRVSQLLSDGCEETKTSRSRYYDI